MAKDMNFSWVIENKLAGCKGPASGKDLEYLAKKGIRALVRMEAEQQSGISSEKVTRKKLIDFYEQVEDFTAPKQHQLDRMVQFAMLHISKDRPTAISCGAGYGRSGTVLACCLVAIEKLTADDALREICKRRPCSEELFTVDGQKEAVDEFERNHRAQSGEIGERNI